MTSVTCKRLTSIDYPKVWHRFVKIKNNVIMKFKIQDLTEDYFDDVFELAMNEYFVDEPWASNTKIAEDPIAINILRKHYRHFVLPQNVSIVCLEDNDSQSKQKVVGFNFLTINRKCEMEDFNGFIKLKNIYKYVILHQIFKQNSPNFFDKYDTDIYLGGTGLCVKSEYRGMNISTEILKTRKNVCKTLGIKYSNTIFTGTASQICAMKAGFEVDASVSYEKLRLATGLEFKDCVDCKVMTLKVSKMFSLDWKRPSSIESQVWHRFEKTNKDGKTIKFKVQDLTEEYYDDVFELLLKDYIKDEPWAKNTKIGDDPESVELFMQFYKERVLSHNVSLVCLEDDDTQTNKKIVGFNFLAVSQKDDPEDYSDLLKTKSIEDLMTLFGAFKQYCPNIFEKYKTDTYLGAIGLCVNSEFRGMNISTEILKTRYPLCKALGIKISNTIFTASASQKTATKAGFELDASVSYDDLRAATGLEFKNCVDCKMMTLQIE